MRLLRTINPGSALVYVYVTTTRVAENVATGKDMPTVNVSYLGSQQQCHEVTITGRSALKQTPANTASPVGASVYLVTGSEVMLWMRD